MKVALVIFFLATAVAAPAYGDSVYMLDGSVREGVIEAHDANVLHLRVEREGITGTLTIPMSQISRAVINRRNTAGGSKPTLPKPTPAAMSEPLKADPQPAGPDLLEGASLTDYIKFRDHGMMLEFIHAAAGTGLDDVNRLPPAARLLWIRANHSEAAGRLPDTLENLRQLEAGMRGLPDGIKRLSAIAKRERGESFGVWMGRIHWTMISAGYSAGAFELDDVRDVERPVLVGYFKEKMGPALQPLQSYFPPIDEKTGQYGAFKASQLQNITASNAIDVKENATYAAAVLLAQLKLEPAMPAVDKGMLYNQLAIVNRIKGRAADLESAAKAAIIRAEQDRRAAEEKARRDAAISAQKARTQPK
jgi:hypothetical protein